MTKRGQRSAILKLDIKNSQSGVNSVIQSAIIKVYTES